MSTPRKSKKESIPVYVLAAVIYLIGVLAEWFANVHITIGILAWTFSIAAAVFLISLDVIWCLYNTKWLSGAFFHLCAIVLGLISMAIFDFLKMPISMWCVGFILFSLAIIFIICLVKVCVIYNDISKN